MARDKVALVTGGAGFIGSHLVSRIVRDGWYVRVVDNFSTGKWENLEQFKGRKDFEIMRGDLKSSEDCARAVKGIETVFHFAANPEVRVSTINPRVHFEENLLTTFNLLDAMRQSGNAKSMLFASSSAVYGDISNLPVDESYPNPKPVSVYGAVKLAGENIISTFSRLYGFKVACLRFANIVGPKIRHGVIYDLLMKLRKSPDRLEILGDGNQRKSYLHVDDAVEATLKVLDALDERTMQVYNVGSEDWISVREIADIVVHEAGRQGIPYEMVPATDDGRGWIGDIKLMILDISKLKSLGYEPKMNSYEAVQRTARSLVSELDLCTDRL